MITFRLQAVFLGPNIHAAEPVLVVEMKADPGLFAVTNRRIHRLNQQLGAWFNYPEPAGPIDHAIIADFICRFTHAILNQTSGEIRTARVLPGGSAPQLVLGHYQPQATLQALQLSARLITGLDGLSPEDTDRLLRDFWKSAPVFHPDFQAKILIDHAEANGIPSRPALLGSRTWIFGWGARSVTLFESSGMADSAIGLRWAKDKMMSKQLFAKLGAPVAPSVVVQTEAELADAAKAVGFPCVTKPLNRGRSIGVSTNLKTPTDLLRGFRTAAKETTDGVLVERHHEGELHRAMVIRGKLWRVIRRARPSVVGDGRLTILQLTEQLARTIPAKRQPKDFRGPAPADAEFHAALADQGLTADMILPTGVRARIRNIPTTGTGCSFDDLTDDVHPDVRSLCESLAMNFGVETCGIDYITTDIGKSCFGHGVFLEINGTPGLRTPIMAGADPAETARVILGDTPAALPLTLVIAPRECLDALAAARPVRPGTGWISDRRCGIDQLEFPDPTPDSHAAFDRIIRHKTVERLFVFCVPEDIMRQGLVTQRSMRTWVLASAGLDDAWMKVLRDHAQDFAEVGTAAELAEKIAAS